MKRLPAPGMTEVTGKKRCAVPSIFHGEGVALTISITPLLDPETSATSAQYQHQSGNGSTLEPRALLESSFGLVERVIAYTSRRRRLLADDADEFAGFVHLKLVENDYSILRKFEGRSSLETFLAVVVQHLFLDHRAHLWGKWRASSVAKNLGDAAVEIERIVRRDGRSVEEAATMLRSAHPELTPASIAALVKSLPERPLRRRFVDLDAAAHVGTEPNQIPASARQLDSDRISKVVHRFLASLEPTDRLIFRLRFENDMTIAEIARSVRVEQRPLYRMFERNLRCLREALRAEGITDDEAVALIGDPNVVLNFRLVEPPAPAEQSSE